MKINFWWTNPDEDNDSIDVVLNGESHTISFGTALDCLPSVFEEVIGRQLTNEEMDWVWSLSGVKDDVSVIRDF